jgi:chromosome partitioning protein
MGIVVAVGTPKGGSGKSTLCALLADAYAGLGWSVVILDADKQRSAVQWMEQCEKDGRKPKGVSVVEASGVEKFTARLEEAKSADVVLIDLPGVLDQMIGLAASRAHLFVIPSRASLADFREVVKLRNYLRDMFAHIRPIPMAVVLNGVEGIEPKTHAFKEALAYLQSERVPHMRMMIRSRPVYKTMIGGVGLSDADVEPETLRKAKENIQLVADEILAMIEQAGALT